MSSRIFRIWQPNEPKGDPAERRRAQLRRAQRTYRDRKDGYIKALEMEVAKVRGREKRLARESQQLHATVRSLTDVISGYGLHVPPQPRSDDRFHHDALHHDALAAADRPLHPKGSRPRPVALMPPPAPPPGNQTAGHGAVIAVPQLLSPDSLGDDSVADQQKLAANALESRGNILEHPNSCIRLCELDLTTVGMDFVLTLEQPCLSHLHGNAEKPHDPSGHALTLSAQLAFPSSGPSPSGTPAPPRWSPPAPESESESALLDGPGVLLSRLLNLAPSLTAAGEVTPVQAWNYIRCQPYFGGIEVRGLRRLAERLRDAVKCHGFGAVVDDEILKTAVYETVLGHVF